MAQTQEIGYLKLRRFQLLLITVFDQNTTYSNTCQGIVTHNSRRHNGKGNICRVISIHLSLGTFSLHYSNYFIRLTLNPNFLTNGISPLWGLGVGGHGGDLNLTGKARKHALVNQLSLVLKDELAGALDTKTSQEGMD